MKLSAFLDELITIEAARVASLHDLRARLTAENAPDGGDIPFDLPEPPQRAAKPTAIDTAMGAHLEPPARQPPVNNYRCKCSLPARRVPPTGWIEKAGKKPWAAFACPKEQNDKTKCDYWYFDPNAPKVESRPARQESFAVAEEDMPDWAR